MIRPLEWPLTCQQTVTEPSNARDGKLDTNICARHGRSDNACLTAYAILLATLAFAGTLHAQRDRGELYRDAAVRVRVVDAKGAPLPGFSVTATFPLGNSMIAAVLGTSFRLTPLGVPPLDVIGTTDAKGECSLALATGGMPLAMIAAAVGAGELPVEIGLRGPFPNATRVRFIMGKLPKSPVVLTCPASTSVSVHVATADGTPDTRPSFISVADLPPATLAGSSSPARSHSIELTSQEGQALFSHVECGQRIRIAARIKGEPEVRFTEIEVPDTTTGTEPIIVVLEPSAVRGESTLEGRIVNVDGTPLANAAVDIVLRTGSGLLLDTGLMTPPPPIRIVGHTDKKGRLRLSLGECANPDPWVETQVEIVVDRSESALRLRALARFSRGLRAGVEHLGDVTLQDPPLLASGRVRMGGEPLANALVSVEESQPQIFGMLIPKRDEESRRVAFDRWFPLPVPKAVTAADGTFAIHGFSEAPTIRVVASRPGHLPANDAIKKAGAKGIDLEMVRGCQLGGRVLLDEGIATGAITVNLAGEFERDIRQPPTAPAWSADAVLELITHGRDQDIGPDGHFEFEAIPAGEAVVTVYASQTEVFKSRPITLRRGDSASPKELAAIDLRGLLTTRRIAVADASSKPIDGALVRFWSDDMRQGPVETLTDEQGIAHVTSVGNKPINLHIKGPPEGNWTPASLESVAATATATLQHPPMVRVTIKNPEALPRPPYFLSCVLTPVDIQDDDKRSPFGMSESGAIFDGTGVGEVAVEKPGKYEVRMNVWAIMPDLGWDCPLEFEGPHIVELAGDGSDHFQIDVARGAWIDAISQTTRIVFR